MDERLTVVNDSEPFFDLDFLPPFKKELKPRKVVGLGVHSWGTRILCLARPGFFVLSPPRPKPSVPIVLPHPHSSSTRLNLFLVLLLLLLLLLVLVP